MTGTGCLVLIGCYTAESGGRGEGVVAARRDPDSGELTVIGTVAVTPSPSYLAWYPRLSVLYAVNELSEGTVSAWTAGPDGSLAALAVRSTGGDSPCHLALTPTGSHLFVANYGSGSVTVHPLGPAGAPTERSDLREHQGHGADPDRQDRAHVHMVSPDPDGGPLLAVDLGTDAVYRYDLDAGSGRLVLRGRPAYTRPGTGPRHLARHPDGRRCYLAGELDGSVIGYQVSASGELRERGRVAASHRDGEAQPSEIAVGADGRFLYVGNRGIGTISIFSLDGELPWHVAEVSTGGSWPRHLALIGRHLYVADERADQVRVFALDPVTGVPEPGGGITVASPTCVLPVDL